MVRNDSAKEYLSPRETGNTKQELDWLKKIIGDKDKKQTVDNINFEEKFKDKNLDNNVSDKIKSLDVLADTLFDTYMIEKQNIIKDILNGQSSIEDRRTAIKEQFTGFIQNIQDPEKVKQYENNKDLSNAINTFNTVFEAFKEKLYTESQTTIELSQLELNHLKDAVLGSVSSSTFQYTNMGNNYKSYNPYHGVNNYTTNPYNGGDYTTQPDSNYNNGEIINDIDQEPINQDNISRINSYNPINDMLLYKGSSYLERNEDEGDLPENTPDKRALQKLLSGKDKNLIIVDQKFKPTDGEKKLLRNLKENIKDIGLDTFSDEIRYVKGLYFQNNGKVDRKDEDKNIGELGTLYSAAMEKSNEYPYFSKVLKLLSEEFITNPNITFMEIYNKYNSVPNRKELGLAKENRNILQRTFNSHSKAFNILQEADGSLETPEAKELIKRSRKLDINKTIEDNMRRVEKSRSEGYEDESMKGKGKESEFISFLAKKLEPTIFNDGKKNHLYEVLSGQYSFELSPSQESFLQLLNATRLGMGVEQYANTKQVSEKSEIANSLEEKNNKFTSRLFDLNSDGRLDFGDGSIRTGLQLRSYYEAATIEIGEEKVLSNLIDTAKTFANSKNFKNYDVILNSINGQTTTEAKIDRFLDEFRDPGFIKFLQLVLLESPLDPNLIFTQGKDAFKHYTEMLDDLNEEDKRLLHNHIDEQLKDYDVNPIIKEGIFQSLATPLIQAKQQGLGAGVFVSLDNILKGLSINIGTGFVGNTPSVLGINLARNKSFSLDKDTALYTGTSLGLVNGFIPVASIGGGIERWITNKGKKTLDASSAQKIALGPNITLIGGVIPSFGVGAGFGVDKMKGIEEQTNYIRKGVTPLIQEFLKNYELIDGTKPESIKLLKRILKKQFGDSDPETLEKAANNMYTALTYFGFTDSDHETLQNNVGHFSSLLADFYVTNRTNEQMMGLDRWHFSSASLGVQFLAGYYPIPTVCVQIAKYKNMYYKDTPESIRKNDIAETTGFGNEFKEFANNQEIVDYLNKVLPVGNNKIILSPDGKYFIIPNVLYQRQSININIDPDLKGYLKETEDKKAIQVPVATQLRYMLRNQGTDAIHVLNIGDIKTEQDDLHLRIAKSVPKDWIGDKETANQTIDVQKSLNDEITKFKNKYPLFPINKALVQGNLVTYYDKNNTAITSLTNILLNKSITINRTSNTGYTVAFANSTDGQHKLIYKEQSGINRTHTISSINRITNSFETNIGKIEEKLKTLDNVQDSDFENFMIQSSTSQTILESSELLIKLLDKVITGKRYDPDINPNVDVLKKELNSTNIYNKTLIVNRVKSIFADNYGNNLKNIDSISNIIKNRGNEVPGARHFNRTNVTGPSKKSLDHTDYNGLFENIQSIREDLKKGPNNKFVKPEGPIFGYTAWYRKGANKDAKNWSMTSPGYTNILDVGNNFYAKKMENPEKARAWFLDNFNNDIQEQQILKDTLNNMIKNTANLPKDLFNNLDLSKIRSLLERDPNGAAITIDIGSKIYKIKLDIDWIFYLLKECANESIGFVPRGIEITEETKTSIEDKISITPAKVGLQINTTGTINRADMAQKATRQVNLTFVKQKPKEDKVTTEVVEEKDITIEVQPEDQFVDNGDGSYTRIDGNGNQTIFIPDDPIAFEAFLNGNTENNIFTGSELPSGDGTDNERIQGNGQAPGGYGANSFGAGVGVGSEDLRNKKKK